MDIDSPLITEKTPPAIDYRDAKTNQMDMLMSLVAEEVESGTPIKKITPSLLWNKMFIKCKVPDQGDPGAGPRIAKCLVYKLSDRLANLLEERQSHLFRGSKLINELREINRTRYPPYTRQVTSDSQWQEYMDKAESLYLVRRNLQQHSERRGVSPFNGSTKLQARDIFTGELAPPRPVGRVGGGRVGRPPKIRDHDITIYDEDEEENHDTPSRIETEVPLTVESAWQRIWDLGGEEEVIGGRVVPPRIKRAGY